MSEVWAYKPCLQKPMTIPPGHVHLCMTSSNEWMFSFTRHHERMTYPSPRFKLLSKECFFYCNIMLSYNYGPSFCAYLNCIYSTNTVCADMILTMFCFFWLTVLEYIQTLSEDIKARLNLIPSDPCNCVFDSWLSNLIPEFQKGPIRLYCLTLEILIFEDRNSGS